MQFKDISYLELWQRNGTICVILVEGIIVNNNFEFRPVVKEEMLFKDISYLKL